MKLHAHDLTGGLDEEDAVLSNDPLTLLSGKLRTMGAYVTLASRRDLPEVVQLRVAERVSGSMLSYSPSGGPACVQSGRAFFTNHSFTPLAVAVAATSLGGCTDSGRQIPSMVELLLAHPSCTPAARVRAAWSLTVENGFYLTHHREDTLAALEALGEDCAPARLAGTLGVALREGDDHVNLGRQVDVSTFSTMIEAVHEEMGGSLAAAETFCALLPEREGTPAELAQAVRGMLTTGRETGVLTLTA